jgi:hypothetical protein
MVGPQPRDHAGAMGEEVGGVPRAGGGHGRGLVVLGFISPRSAKRGWPVHAWRASAVAAEGRGRAVVEVGSRDAGVATQGTAAAASSPWCECDALRGGAIRSQGSAEGIRIRLWVFIFFINLDLCRRRVAVSLTWAYQVSSPKSKYIRDFSKKT